MILIGSGRSPLHHSGPLAIGISTCRSAVELVVSHRRPQTLQALYRVSRASTYVAAEVANRVLTKD